MLCVSVCVSVCVFVYVNCVTAHILLCLNSCVCNVKPSNHRNKSAALRLLADWYTQTHLYRIVVLVHWSGSMMYNVQHTAAIFLWPVIPDQECYHHRSCQYDSNYEYRSTSETFTTIWINKDKKRYWSALTCLSSLKIQMQWLLLVRPSLIQSLVERCLASIIRASLRFILQQMRHEAALTMICQFMCLVSSSWPLEPFHLVLSCCHTWRNVFIDQMALIVYCDRQ